MTRYRALFMEGFRSTFRRSTLIGAALIGLAGALLNLSGGAILLALVALAYGACCCTDESGSV